MGGDGWGTGVGEINIWWGGGCLLGELFLVGGMSKCLASVSPNTPLSLMQF